MSTYNPLYKIFRELRGHGLDIGVLANRINESKDADFTRFTMSELKEKVEEIKKLMKQLERYGL